MVLRFCLAFCVSTVMLASSAAEVRDVEGRKIYDTVRTIQKIDLSFRAAEVCRMSSNIVAELARQRDAGKSLEEVLLKFNSNEEVKAQARMVYAAEGSPNALSDKIYFECELKARKKVLEDVQV